MDEIQEQIARLKTLLQQEPTPALMSEVLAALHHKREGIQAHAVKVLGAWGTPEAVAALRDFLRHAFTRKFGWGIRGVAIKALIPLVGASDVDWVLDLYFGLGDSLHKHELCRLVHHLPPQAARERLVSELRSGNAVNRQAAVKAIGNMAYADRLELLRPLIFDPSRLVSQSARLLTAANPERLFRRMRSEGEV